GARRSARARKEFLGGRAARGAGPMTPTELYAALQGRDVRLSVQAGRLRVDAPDGVLSEQEWTLLAEPKAALIAILPSGAYTSPPAAPAPEWVPRSARDTAPAWADALAQEVLRRKGEVLHALASGEPAPMVPGGDAVFRGDCRRVLSTLPEASVQLVVTSPPYNVGWDYGDGGAGDRRPLPDYQAPLVETLAGCRRVLRPGGVLALNVPPTIRLKDAQGATLHRAWPLAAWLQMHLEKAGWLLREPIAWVKSKQAD